MSQPAATTLPAGSHPVATEQPEPLVPAPTGPATDVLERVDELPITGDGDHERFAHIVAPASAVTEAMVMGTPVTALCGKTWVPTRDPNRYPVCKTCLEVLDAARAARN